MSDLKSYFKIVALISFVSISAIPIKIKSSLMRKILACFKKRHIVSRQRLRRVAPSHNLKNMDD